METKTPTRGWGSRIAREGSEDVVPVDREAAYDEEVGEEPVIDTPKTTRRNKQRRQPSRGRVDVRAGTVSDTEEIVTEEPPTVKKPGRGRAGKNEEVEPRLPRTPARGRPRKNSRPAHPKAIEPDDQDLPDDDDEEEEEEGATQSTLFNAKPTTKKKSAKGKELAAEPELYSIPEEGAAGLSNASNQDVVLPTTEVEEVQQQRLVKVKAAKVQQADTASQPMSQPVNQSANQPANQSTNPSANQAMNQPANQHLRRLLSSWIVWALPFFLLAALFSGVFYLAYIQFEEINSTTNIRVKTVEQQLEKVMNPEIPTPDRRRVDWFSFGLGALPIVNLCTPPYRIPPPDPPKKTWPWSKPVPVIESDETRLKRVQVGRIVSPLNASQALLHWDEPSPRYCVRALGKLQLAVFTPRNITPTELVIEDYHKDEVLRIGTAPRDVELWMSASSRDQKLLNTQINDNFRHIRAIRTTRTPGPDLRPGSAQLTKDWIPIGRWRYNIYAEDNVQKFKIQLEMGNAASRNFAVRIINNWGDYDLICLVRARLHGIDRSKVRERLLPEQIVVGEKSQEAGDNK